MKIKTCCLWLVFLVPAITFAQRVISPSNEFKVEGKIKVELKFTLADLNTFASDNIKDLELHNQKGKSKSIIKGLKGIPMKNILAKAEFAVDKPKELNEFYFIFCATDDYKPVFSWNEIYNTQVGNTIYVITEKEGKKLSEMDERILVVSTSDLKIGRRYIKGLSKIVITSVD